MKLLYSLLFILACFAAESGLREDFYTNPEELAPDYEGWNKNEEPINIWDYPTLEKENPSKCMEDSSCQQISHWGSHPPACGLGASPFCQTYRGNICTVFAVNYPLQVFSSCVQIGFLFACANIPLPVISFTSGCFVRGAPCLCNWPNGYYEPGFII